MYIIYEHTSILSARNRTIGLYYYMHTDNSIRFNDNGFKLYNMMVVNCKSFISIHSNWKL